MKWGECFAYQNRKCTILIGARPPWDCEGCRFKKRKADVTDGKKYKLLEREEYLEKHFPNERDRQEKE